MVKNKIKQTHTFHKFVKINENEAVSVSIIELKEESIFRKLFKKLFK